MHLGHIPRAALAAAALVASTACAPTPSHPSPATSAPTTVDASLLAPGAVVALVARPGSTSLEVITPDGVRHTVHTASGDATLVDWRPDLHTALLRVGGRAVSYDVTTGELHRVRLPRTVVGVGLDPSGAGVVVNQSVGPRRAPGVERRIAPVRLSWSGERTRLAGTAGAEAIGSDDGRTLVVPANVRRAWWVHELRTGRARDFPTPGTCGPVRWLDEHHVLASCYSHGGNRLTSIGLDGSAVALGPRHRVGRGSEDPVIADADVRRLAGTAWFASYDGRRPAYFLTRRDGDRTVEVRLDGVRSVTDLVGTRDGHLVLAATGVGRASVLALADPVSRTTTTWAQLDDTEEWQRVVGATEVRAWGA